LAFSEECSCMVNFPNVLKAKKNNGWNQWITHSTITYIQHVYFT
jgi:hypothetical protein